MKNPRLRIAEMVAKATAEFVEEQRRSVPKDAKHHVGSIIPGSATVDFTLSAIVRYLEEEWLDRNRVATWVFRDDLDAEVVVRSGESTTAEFCPQERFRCHGIEVDGDPTLWVVTGISVGNEPQMRAGSEIPLCNMTKLGNITLAMADLGTRIRVALRNDGHNERRIRLKLLGEEQIWVRQPDLLSERARERESSEAGEGHGGDQGD